MPSRIEWTDETWNPVTGCTPISAGCEHCYARRSAIRLAGRAGYPADDPFRVTPRPERLAQPFQWSSGRRVFLCSMGDLFHDEVPDDYIEAVIAVISVCGEHTFQLLTKRPARMRAWFASHTLSACQAELVARERYEPVMRAENERDEALLRRGKRLDYAHRSINGAGGDAWPLPNLWLGVTAENQQTADERIPELLETPAALRFVSCEPLLERIELSAGQWAAACDRHWLHAELPVVGIQARPRLDWVIVGGETGLGRRAMNPDWAGSLRDQCAAARVPFFFKGHGGPRSREGRDLLDGRLHQAFPGGM